MLIPYAKGITSFKTLTVFSFSIYPFEINETFIPNLFIAIPIVAKSFSIINNDSSILNIRMVYGVQNPDIDLDDISVINPGLQMVYGVCNPDSSKEFKLEDFNSTKMVYGVCNPDAGYDVIDGYEELDDN